MTTRQTAFPACDVQHAIEKLPELVNSDEELRWRGKYTSCDLMLQLGDIPYYLRIVNGEITRHDRGPLLMRCWSFAISGPEESWAKFWLPYPPPHFHDLFALTKRGGLRLAGDIRPLMTNLLYFKGVLSAPRRHTEHVA
jgi:hypothetical protein